MMHGPINFKSPNNISKLQMGFNSAFKGLKSRSLRGITRGIRHTTFTRTNITDTGGIRTRNPRKGSAVDLHLRPRGHQDRLVT
jgi:hypothetical protein